MSENGKGSIKMPPMGCILTEKDKEIRIKGLKSEKEKPKNKVNSLAATNYAEFQYATTDSAGNRCIHNNQRFGTCVSQAVAKLLEFMEIKKNKRVLSYSTSWIYGNRFVEGSGSGMATGDALDKIVQDCAIQTGSNGFNGQAHDVDTALEKEHPYDAIEAKQFAYRGDGDTYSLSPLAKDMVAKDKERVRIFAAGNIKPRSWSYLDVNANSIYNELRNNAPVLLSIDGGQAIYAATHPPYVFVPKTGGGQGSHCVIVVGVKNIVINSVSTPCFVIWNSWGETEYYSGDKGNLYIPFNQIDYYTILGCYKVSF